MDTLAEGLRWLLAFPLVSYLWYQFAAISYIIRTCIPSLHFILLPVYVSGEPHPLIIYGLSYLPFSLGANS